MSSSSTGPRAITAAPGADHRVKRAGGGKVRSPVFMSTTWTFRSSSVTYATTSSLSPNVSPDDGEPIFDCQNTVRAATSYTLIVNPFTAATRAPVGEMACAMPGAVVTSVDVPVVTSIVYRPASLLATAVGAATEYSRPFHVDESSFHRTLRVSKDRSSRDSKLFEVRSNAPRLDDATSNCFESRVNSTLKTSRNVTCDVNVRVS